MSRPLLLALALAVAAPACSLIANPNDHVGGTRDAGSGDAARDTGDGHVGPID